MKIKLIGIGIYITFTLIILGLCGVWPLLIPGFILWFLLYFITKDKSEQYIYNCLGIYWLQNKFKDNPFFKNITMDE